MMNLWLIGDTRNNVPPLRCITAQNVGHIKNGPNKLSKMKSVMKVVENYGRNRSVWHANGRYWNGARVTALWTAIWKDLETYMKGRGSDKPVRIRTGQIRFRSVYNSMQEKGLFRGSLQWASRQMTLTGDLVDV
jgi:hypothetical protein